MTADTANASHIRFLATAATPQSNVPDTVILDDNPIYTKFLMYRAEGKSYRTIARLTGYSAEHISVVCRQPWFQEKLREYIALSGADRIMKLYTIELENCLDTLIELRDHSKSDAVRFNSSREITDRVLGKTIQQIDDKRVPDINLSENRAEQSEIDKEIQFLEQQLSFTTGG